MGKENKNKVVLIAGVVILVIIILLFIPSLLNDKKELDELEYEGQLIQEGKVVSDTDVINEIVKVLKERNANRLNQYITTDFEYWRNRKATNNKFILDRFTIFYER